MTRRNKYGNRRVVYDGYSFDSMAERDHYVVLCLRQAAGDISGLKMQQPYVIFDAFVNVTGQRRAKITYKPDFEYVDSDGHMIYEDVKGVETAVFRIKRKLFEQRYGVALQIIKV